MLPFLKKYVAATSLKPPSSNSYTKVESALKDDMIAAKLGFLQSVALELEPYLTRYQSNDPLLPFMYQDLYALLRTLMLRFIKTDIMNGATNASTLLAIDCTKKENHKLVTSIGIGFAASSACKNEKGISVLRFKEDCLVFLKHLTSKLVAKCPLKYHLVKGATCFNPDIMLSETLRVPRVSCALDVFVEKKRMSPAIADKVKRAYITLCEQPSVQSALRAFKRKEDRLDRFLMSVLKQEDTEPGDALLSFMKQILVLFHGNAAVERSFSINKECLVENLHEDSLIAQRCVYDAVATCGGVSAVPISKAMIHSVRNSSGKRLEALKKKKDEDSDKANTLKRVAAEMKLLQAKKARIAQQAKEEVATVNSELQKLQNLLK